MSSCFNAPSRRIFAAIAAASLGFGSANLDNHASAATFDRPAVGDAYINSSYPLSNFGQSKLLRSKTSSPVAIAYMKFDTGGVAFPVAKATLEFYSKSKNSKGLDIRNASGWEEGSLNYSNRPALQEVRASTGRVHSRRLVSVDVTEAVNIAKNADFALTTSSGSYIDIASRETVTEAPRVIFEAAASDPIVEPAQAYFVDAVNGRDSNTGKSPETAWQTLEKASSASLAPGESLLLKRGDSWTGSLTLGQTGTADAPVKVRAYGTGAHPVIQGGGSCLLVTGNYVSVSDIEARDCLWAGVEIKGSNNAINNSVVANNVAGVHIASGAANNVISRNQIRDNNKMSVLTSSPNNDDSGAFGILVNGDDNEISFNTISGSDAFSYDYGRDGGAVEIYGGQRNNIHHNYALENDTFAELGDPRSADNLFAYNAVRSSLEHSLFLVTRGAQDAFGPVARTSLFNNSVALSGAQSQGVVCYAGCSAQVLRMRNNIVQAVWKVGYADAPFDEDYDLFYGGVIQFTPGPNTVQADPLWVDVAGANLRLQASSPAIDKGVQLGFSSDLDGALVPLDGNGDGVASPDRGAYELKK